MSDQSKRPQWIVASPLAMHLAVLALLLLFPSLALAGDGLEGEGVLPYENGLNALTKSLTGTVAFAISMIGIVACGAMLIFGGEISGFMRTMIFIILVAAVIVQSATIVHYLEAPDARLSVASFTATFQGAS